MRNFKNLQIQEAELKLSYFKNKQIRQTKPHTKQLLKPDSKRGNKTKKNNKVKKKDCLLGKK